MKITTIVLAASISVLSGCVGYVPVSESGYSTAPDYRYENRGNRGDRDRDRDGIPNRVDRDRDGDGIPNRMDGRPNNPNRY